MMKIAQMVERIGVSMLEIFMFILQMLKDRLTADCTFNAFELRKRLSERHGGPREIDGCVLWVLKTAGDTQSKVDEKKSMGRQGSSQAPP
ncbi:hypothetical protein PHPALM_28142 [Phytophthora palmivora]|uniref:Uncharacterized protein n=1 Tax=Phytophthora palmivora TaxID=4796 RepID=A0A2P4XAX8_9STRA|nr:hypothetical protein PHPALM_28142 [Phytophthora palmivora]